MNREETQAAIAVMQAWLDGREITFSPNNTTLNVNYTHPVEPAPDWDWASFTYRIKPEPREFWIVDGEATFHGVKIRTRRPDNTVGWIKVREIIE